MPAGEEGQKDILTSWLLGKRPSAKTEEDDGVAEDIDAAATPEAASKVAADRLAETGVLSEGKMAKLLLAPKASMGTVVEERHRVLQVSLGSQHGVLLNDAGIAFTWGDNRYGQLGRSPVLKEENGTPFPVLGLLGEEVLQVSAGTHHCLALVAPGYVWAWGRNKAGQLGVGDHRDRVQPVKVCHPSPAEKFGDGVQLGTIPGGRILTLSAGMNSSVAAALDSCVWQWGEISSGFQESLVASGTDKAKKDAHTAAVVNRPFCAFKRDAFRTQMRQGPVSISKTGCRVLDKDMYTDKDRLQNLVEGVRQLQGSINQDRINLAKMDAEDKKQEEAEAAPDKSDELAALQDTISTLERDIMLIERDIDAYMQSLQSCDLRQAHNRNQLQQLQQQGTTLRDMQDKVSLEIFMAQKGGADRRKQEERSAEVEEFLQANKNTRMTLLDQRAETDKEKQRITHALGERRRKRDRLQRRLETVRDLSKSTKASSSGASDALVKVLQQQTLELREHFERRTQQQDFLTAMKVFHNDMAFLEGVESKMKEMSESVSANDATRADRANLASTMLMDLVNLRRSWCDLLQDRWSKDGLDLSCFFENAAKPQAGDGPHAQKYADVFQGEALHDAPKASPGAPALEPLSTIFGAPDDAMGAGRASALTSAI